ncbi:MAG: UDP-N-acetylmuramate:L-alanyl-gamma-D-glutamyl-meso-diaminopimelate ligase [Gammaproteobacteria bacterium]|nr:UDP-N-acetylmuramate:L-alanyl-gamma-D-glutamyl-meso-diaminopimelate ligase [Gammaproteobacteria bacterium]
MKIHILGISGTFMSGLALIAKEVGFEVTGCDENCYPPVSDLLQAKGIEWIEGYEVSQAFIEADLVVVGNAMKRGMPIVEAMLEQKKRYVSGPQWLFETVLCHQRVIAISGTHGKTTTTSMVAHVLDQAGLQPGFLIGGVAPNFGTNARLGAGKWFVIEADEYDTAFFDKRPKFMHYHPELAILNNLEFDHADIYSDLASIEQQFSYYLRTIPPQGTIVMPRQDVALQRVIENGCYSKLERTAIDGESADWWVGVKDESTGQFEIYHEQKKVADVHWDLLGRFNIENGLHAFVVSQHVGIDANMASRALETFQPVKRRLELRGTVHGIAVYDDFAHHPTAIQKTLEALKRSGRHQRIVVALEFASYTMKMGVHEAAMPVALSEADHVVVLESPHFDVSTMVSACDCPTKVLPTTQSMIDYLLTQTQSGDAVVVMSNRGFERLHERLIEAMLVYQ